MPDEAERKRLEQEQAARAERERDLAEQTSQEEDRHVHERRSDKAAYLREKLKEQGRTPDE